MSTPTIYRIIIPVTDMVEAECFYSAVLSTRGERVSPGRHYFKCGSIVLVCYDPVADRDNSEGDWRHHANQYIYFATDELGAIRTRVVESGGRDVTAIEEMPWGERLFYARDPFGTPICFVDEKSMFTGGQYFD